MVAAKIVEVVSGSTWESFMRTRIFSPLNMTRTIILEEERNKSTNISTAHIKNNALEVIPIQQEKLDNLAPAGSFYSTSTDMAQYMMFVMNRGIANGDTLVQPQTFNEILKPQSHFQAMGEAIHNEFTSYGFGWWLTPKGEHKIIDHSGGVDGAGANVIMVDDTKFGVVVLCNASSWTPFKISFDVIGNEIEDDGYIAVGRWMMNNANRRNSMSQIEHQEFIDKVANLESRFNEGKLIMSIEITSFLKKWMINHIQGSDMHYSKYLAEKGVNV